MFEVSYVLSHHFYIILTNAHVLAEVRNDPSDCGPRLTLLSISGLRKTYSQSHVRGDKDHTGKKQRPSIIFKYSKRYLIKTLERHTSLEHNMGTTAPSGRFVLTQELHKQLFLFIENPSSSLLLSGIKGEFHMTTFQRFEASI